ncbi:hypothetical protein [Georgenia muralis]|uniref:Uncharacterized protein n=1 Tax=Georgenia muralis TaxID=154117 RepID=A0A3N4Z975_9MICO|nr:hypothetical protein [Georgenia muralis]RPF28584.1 hypothetical protein EDD32_3117 [Georgenia muralis]
MAEGCGSASRRTGAHVHPLWISVCRAVLKVSGHRFCCEIAGWLAGPSWQPVDVKPSIPDNIVWRFGQILFRYGND